MTTDLGSTFSANLKRLRTRRNLSQEALARETHLSVSMISMLERAQREPSFASLEQLAAALAVRPADLLKARA